MVYELLGLVVTEPFILHEYKCLINDTLFDEYFPEYFLIADKKNRLKSPLKAKRKKELDELKALNKNEDREELMQLNSQSAAQAWKEYKGDTHHSKRYFLTQREKVLGGVAELTKRYNLLMSKVSSLNALHRKSTVNVLLAAMLPSMNTIAAGPEQKAEEAPVWVGEKTVEETLISGDPYSCQIKCSQLSPFMKKYAAKHYTSRDIVVPSEVNAVSPKFPSPKKVSLKKKTDTKTKMPEILNLKRIQCRSNSIENPRIVTMDEDAQEMPCMCGKCLGEFWNKHGIPDKHAKKMTDFTSHQERTKVSSNKYRRYGSEKKRYIPKAGLSPDEKLGENTMFNELYCNQIKKHLAKVEEELAEGDAKFSLYQKEVEAERKEKYSPRKKSKQKRTIKEDQSLPVLTVKSQKGPTEGTRKMHLMNVIKKLESRYVDKKAIAENELKAKEKKSRLNLMQMLKTTNDATNKELDEVDRLARKYTYMP